MFFSVDILGFFQANRGKVVIFFLNLLLFKGLDATDWYALVYTPFI